MGIFSQRDIYTTKWITAEVIDSDNRLWPVPIKAIIGNHFLAEIRKQLYCFTLKGSRITTIYNDKSLTKSAKVIHYYTDNANPIDPTQVSKVRALLEKNNLPKINQKMFGMLKILAQDEKSGKEFQPHNLTKLVEQIQVHKEKYPENVKTMENFIKELPTEQINHPIKDITDYLQEDMIAPDPKYLGDVAQTVINLEEHHKIVVNEPAKNKIAWAKLLLVAMLGVLCIVGVYFLFTSNILPHLGPTTNSNAASSSGSTANSQTSNEIMKEYPDPQLLRNAIKNGQVSCNGLDKQIKDYVNTISPAVCP